MTESKSKKGKGGSGSGNGFKALGLSDEVYRGIVRMGFRMPTPVQRKALPVVLTGSDTCIMARTGSGKTCAFLLPLLEKLLSTPRGINGNNHSVRGLILSPTRELSMQTLRVFNRLASSCELRAVGIHGGQGMEQQFALLASRPDVIVATPGRLAHHLTEIPDFTLTGCNMCILDEADRLMEMGFAPQIRQIAAKLPESHCQKVLLSATMPKQLVEFTKSGFCTDPAVVRLDQEASVSEELRIAFITCRSLDKDATLMHILQHIQDDQAAHKETRTGLTLIFAATRHHVEYIATLLEASGTLTSKIYGSMDQLARQQNLSDFKSGRKPVLIVTDVAARGIDVPLIDHVIHYHFPASPKLFVHRSGRAARAGRIGFCWGMVEPDELPYMIDLHLFLGRKPSSGTLAREDETRQELMYELSDMTPDMVHYGSLPEHTLTIEVENVQRIMNSELSSSQDAESLRALSKVCRNAMQQYRRSRPEASREGVRRAKAILEGERLQTGERVNGSSITPHPLLRAAAHQHFLRSQNTDGNLPNLVTIDNLQKREAMLQAISQLRPKETVFEAFATVGTKQAVSTSQMDRRTSKQKQGSSLSLAAMQDMRRQMRIARDKGSSYVVAGAVLDDENDDVAEQPNLADSSIAQAVNSDSCASKCTALVSDEGKRRLSKAERRRLKKEPGVYRQPPSTGGLNTFKPTKKMKGSDFRDSEFFIAHDLSSSEDAQRARQIEAVMQPSAASNQNGAMGSALRIEKAMLDIVGDEKEDLVRNQRMTRWDKSKRKYVQTTVGAELGGVSRSKRVRLESGQRVKNDKLKLGDLYQKWQKKTHQSIGRSGVFDEGTAIMSTPQQLKTKHKPGKASDRVKTATAIKKDRDKRHDIKVKNTKKSDRRGTEQRKRIRK